MNEWKAGRSTPIRIEGVTKRNSRYPCHACVCTPSSSSCISFTLFSSSLLMHSPDTHSRFGQIHNAWTGSRDDKRRMRKKVQPKTVQFIHETPDDFTCVRVTPLTVLFTILEFHFLFHHIPYPFVSWIGVWIISLCMSAVAFFWYAFPRTVYHSIQQHPVIRILVVNPSTECEPFESNFKAGLCEFSVRFSGFKDEKTNCFVPSCVHDIHHLRHISGYQLFHLAKPNDWRLEGWNLIVYRLQDSKNIIVR